MNIIITSLLTVSLLIVAPGCAQKNSCKATDVNSATEEVACLLSDDVTTSQNVKC